MANKLALEAGIGCRLLLKHPAVAHFRCRDICRTSVLHCTIGLKKQFPEYTTSDLAWKKARFGNIVSWIGAEFAVQNNGVIVSMSDDRVSKVRARLEEALRGEGHGGRVAKVGRRVELGRWIDTARHMPVIDVIPLAKGRRI